MARLSPSPSGSSRRLSELLEEQQEPFFLDLYLLAKGCSPTLLDSSAGASSSTCWPRSSRTSQALKNSKKTPASGVLRLLISKILILRGTTAAAAPRKKKLQFDGGKTPSKLKQAVEVNMDEAEEEEDDDDDSSKQLSPVSVLEPRTFEFEQQAPPAYAKKAIVIFRELLEHAAANKQPARQPPKSKNGLMDTKTAAAPAPAPTRTTGRAASAVQLEEMFEAELAKAHEFIAADMAGAMARLRDDVRSERREVAAELAAAVLEAMTEEIAAEILGMDHESDDGAVEDRKRCLVMKC
ncbi:uncharacterized protein LOC104584398 [Brachypodium distachyon]|uniref:Uncharacterized protein n=1 Tax=Brachypodium distachyon TaxID=15368 RepID=I1IID9_BRADI|nr:uncharacterized protein LOC104584398 [Brachypodium distachyon]KQJ86714.1 hypothetical protein BRADI_4g07310v3 [Brachypodium distachyon]|eukprot:XP_010237259.1 uncharacterized protein LOC104584398 [Brachypodium distachyon]